jgi:2-amino-4-hydroxy-6-hydroxymethyldihydropteridine diphosphokinase
MCKVEVFIGLGSNLHEPITQLSKAISAISYIKDAELTNVSGFYENPPLGGVSQPPFVNAVARLETRLGAEELFSAMVEIESALGRPIKRQKWSARIIDLDLLIYGKAIINSEVLTVPHPQIENRSFVLYPLFEIAPKMVVPGLGAVEKLLSRKDVSSLVDTKFVWKREIKEIV